MNVINKKIEELIPYDNNPRHNENAIEYVVKSIREYGFKVPIIIDKNNVIVTGHTRLLAAKELELTEVPCIVADDLTEEQINQFRLVDNKVSEFSKWDFEKLEEELNNIPIDMTEFGFITEMDFDDDIDNFFEEKNEEKEVKPKTAVCPHCGSEFEL